MPMTPEDANVDRRQFIIGGSTALVGAAAAAAMGSTSTAESPAGAQPAIQSPAGSAIPYTRAELLRPGPVRVFAEPHLAQIAFPLGGIGTGTVSLGGRGELRDWEIFNRPNKGRAFPFTFVAIRLKPESGDPIIRIVEGQVDPPYGGSSGLMIGNAQGPVGLARFKTARFTGEYPLARVDFEDDALPVQVSLEAFNPFMPLETDDFSIPVAIFRYRVTNRFTRALDTTLAFSMLNPVGYDGAAAVNNNRLEGLGQNVTRLRRGNGIVGLEMTSQKYPSGDIRAGSMALVTTHLDASARMAWDSQYPPEQRMDRGARWDAFALWFEQFRDTGVFADPAPPEPTLEGTSSYGTLAPRFALKPGETRHVDFLLAWHFPVRENYWNRNTPVLGARLRNDYGTRFNDAWDVASYTVEHLERLEGGTRAFHKAFFDSTLPASVLDAVSSQMSIIRTNTGLLLEGKKFFAFEGTSDNAGCCPLNCTHVWNYEQALAHLFPDLERSMRITDFTINVRDDGAMAFRTLVPTGQALWEQIPAADGQMGCLLKLYREWQMSGDLEFLRLVWPGAKRAIEYAWRSWDADRDGVIEGEQHNTYDIEFFGPNPMIGSLYLGALLAAERMAQAVGDNAAAVEYRRVFESGRSTLDQALWRDGFYIQQIPEARSTAKYQYGEGCLSDQLLGQWFAHVVDLGYLLPVDHVRDAMLSVYRHNFRHSFADASNLHRIYALNDEKGLLLCTWPRGKRPLLPFRYADEVWTGVEYQVAAHLIYEGFTLEGLAITKAVRDRHDGQRRNPWNDQECGSHYARALSSWSLLTALSGAHYSAPEGRLAFAPRLDDARFRCFFTAGTAWGSVALLKDASGTTATLSVVHGALTLREFAVPAHGGASAIIGRRRLDVRRGTPAGTVTFEQPVHLAAGDVLTVRFSTAHVAPESASRGLKE